MKKNQKITLEKKDFSFVCPLKVEDMTDIDGGHHCDECNQKVFDVTDMSKDKYDELVRKTDNICVSFKLAAAATGLMFGLAACSSPKTQPRILGKIAPPHMDKPISKQPHIHDKQCTIKPPKK